MVAMKIKIENSAGGIVYKKENDTYCWLVIENKSTTPYWGFPKGHIADKISNEKAEQAALREVTEEGGITAHITSPTPIKVSYEFRQNDTLYKKTVTYFLMEYVEGDTHNHDHEVQEAIFIPEAEVLNRLVFQNDRNAFLEAKTLLSDR